MVAARHAEKTAPPSFFSSISFFLFSHCHFSKNAMMKRAYQTNTPFIMAHTQKKIAKMSNEKENYQVHALQSTRSCELQQHQAIRNITQE